MSAIVLEPGEGHDVDLRGELAINRRPSKHAEGTPELPIDAPARRTERAHPTSIDAC
jgi:hypothetical protein